MPPTILILELGAVVIGLAILARLAGGLGLSPIPLYLLAGLAFGEGGLFPLVTAEEFITIGAEIGVILLLLLLGLEYSADDLIGNLRVGLPSGVLNVVLNFTPGFVAGLLLGWGVVPALFLGGITYPTSSSVMAKLLGDLGWVGNRETPVVLSLSVMEDLTMALYLPLMAILIRGGQGMGFGLLSIAIAVTVVIAVLHLARWKGSALSRVLFSRSDEVLLLTILGLALLVAGAAEVLQISAAVGAFLVGIAISGPAADRARILLTPLRDLFAAVFFIFFGFRVDPTAITPVLGVALLLAVGTALTKLLTGWWSARQSGVGVRARWRAGALMIVRGEFSVAVAVLAVGAGVEPRLAPLAVTYVMALALLGPASAQLVEPVVLWLRRRRTGGTGTRVEPGAAGPAAGRPPQAEEG